MHMADALLSPAVGMSMNAVSAGALVYSSFKLGRTELAEKKLPLMAVSGAFVFAAQMINFTIPGTGSSGHIGGGMLLAALLGGFPAFLTIAAVLIIQCLFFADGGLLALGCNLFNMGVIPCLLIYPLIFKPLLKAKLSAGKIALASILSSVLALQLGAFAVVLQTTASGIAALPFKSFLLLMQPIHLAIGLVEGLCTAAVLSFIHNLRPELIEGSLEQRAVRVSYKKVLLFLLAAALVLGGVVSLWASAHPDGLEWSIEKVVGEAELSSDEKLHVDLGAVQERTAIMPDYNFTDAESDTGTRIAGLLGAAMTFALALLMGAAVVGVKRIRRRGALAAGAGSGPGTKKGSGL